MSTEIEARETLLLQQIGAAKARIARIVEAERIAAEQGWRFDDLIDPEAGLRAAVEAAPSDLARVVRRLPMEVGMPVATRARFLKSTGII